jgi:S1 RNA binding domain protein
MSIEVGSIVEGIVTGITNFGAFVELPGGQTGLVHISEVADAYVKDVKDFLKDREKVSVKVITIDKGKIGLSIKQAKPVSATPPPSRPGNYRRNDNYHRKEAPNFEDRLAKFMKDSEEKLLEVRRSTDAKRGGRGSKRSY